MRGDIVHLKGARAIRLSPPAPVAGRDPRRFTGADHSLSGYYTVESTRPDGSPAIVRDSSRSRNRWKLIGEGEA